METEPRVENVQITLPNADMSSFHTISRNMGLSLKNLHKSGNEKVPDDIRKENVYNAKRITGNRNIGPRFHVRIYSGQVKRSQEVV